MSKFELAKEYFLDGCLFLEADDFSQAEYKFKKSLELIPDRASTLTNLSAAQLKLKKYSQAKAAAEKAILVESDNSEAYLNLGLIDKELKSYDSAIHFFDKALSLKSHYHEAWSNKGNILKELERYDEAIAHYDKALSLQPDYAEAWSNKGVTLNQLKQYDEAIAHYDKALSLQPDYAEAWSNKGVTLNQLKQYDEAIAHYDKALSLKPGIDWVYGDLLHAKMKICSWLGFAESLADISKKVANNEKVADPFTLLSLNDDALLQKQSSEIYIQDKYPSNLALGYISRRTKNEKIKIGYFSADFKNHPVAFLIAEIFELHDKSQFEIYAFSLVKASDDMRRRLHKAFDHFIDAEGMSNIAIAKLARDLAIDIAIDLSGFTQDSRVGIFTYRTAPIQVSYLGYPGTMGADYIDYIIADKTLIPPKIQSCFLEKVVYLPNSYQANDRKRYISDRKFTRQELGLPQKDFVFCCFNNNFKILPATFASWMRILKAVEDSVLWLFQDNPWAAENLKKEALNHGVDVSRIIFAERMPLSEHLARHRQADLFLDTFPYNAHTTSSDALWTGLPVITLVGSCFASRVAASLLNAIGLPELITSTQEEYEALAIELALNPKKLAETKLKLANNRLSAPLFDAPLFTKNLETAYIKIYQKYHAHLQPDHIFID